MHEVSVTGTGIGGVWRAALVSKSRIARISRFAWVLINRSTGVVGISCVAWVSVAWGNAQARGSETRH